MQRLNRDHPRYDAKLNRDFDSDSDSDASYAESEEAESDFSDCNVDVRDSNGAPCG